MNVTLRSQVRHGRGVVVCVDEAFRSISSRRRGVVVKNLSASAAVGKRQAASFVCTLSRGVYRYSVTARDLAGNLQKRPGHGTLIVH